MQALVKSRREPGLWLGEVDVPKIGINDVLIKVLRTGICGTDLHIYKWDEWAQETIPVPMTIGHEFVGRIVETGSNVADFFPGDLVSGEGHVVCGRCRNCLAGRRHLCAHTQGVGVNRPGAFAEYIALPMTNIWRHHESVSLDVAAIFDPFGNAVHTALSFPVLGEDVLVTGAGPIGIMAAAVARHAGARYTVITDLNPYRLELARKLGVTLAVDVRETTLRRCAEATRHDRGLRRGPGDVRQPRRLPRHDRQHEPRRQDRHAGNPLRRDVHRLAHRHLQHAHHQGHLRPRNVRDLVQDDGHARNPAWTSPRSSPTASPRPNSRAALRPCFPAIRARWF